MASLRTFYLVSPGNRSVLTEDGWLFDSSSPLPETIVERIVEYFGVPFNEEFLGIKKFKNEHTQLNIIYDENGLATEIAVRTSLEKSVIETLQLHLGAAVDIVDPEAQGNGLNSL